VKQEEVSRGKNNGFWGIEGTDHLELAPIKPVDGVLQIPRPGDGVHGPGHTVVLLQHPLESFHVGPPILRHGSLGQAISQGQPFDGYGCCFLIHRQTAELAVAADSRFRDNT